MKQVAGLNTHKLGDSVQAAVDTYMALESQPPIFRHYAIVPYGDKQADLTVVVNDSTSDVTAFVTYTAPDGTTTELWRQVFYIGEYR